MTAKRCNKSKKYKRGSNVIIVLNSPLNKWVRMENPNWSTVYDVKSYLRLTFTIDDYTFRVSTHIYDFRDRRDVLNYYDYNIKVFGLPDIYKWKSTIDDIVFNKVYSILPLDKVKYFKSNDDWTFEKVYSFLESIYNGDHKQVSKMLNLEI